MGRGRGALFHTSEEERRLPLHPPCILDFNFPISSALILILLYSEKLIIKVQNKIVYTHTYDSAINATILHLTLPEYYDHR